jgi:hypothetical protein
VAQAQCPVRRYDGIGPFAARRDTKIELARTLTLKCEVDEVKARMQADGERPPKGDLYVAAVQEVAERIGMEPEALVQRFRRLKAASTPRPSGRSPRASGV